MIMVEIFLYPLCIRKSQEIANTKKYLNNGILPNNMHVVLDGLYTYSLIYQKSGITIFNDNIT